MGGFSKAPTVGSAENSTRTGGGSVKHVHAGESPISQIDTIRVWAMLGVFLHHLWNTVIQTPSDSLQWGLDIVFDAASDGVILFNIISGFLLALPYVGVSRRPFPGSRDFFSRRLLRIIPPYYLALVLFSLANVLSFDVPLDSALETVAMHVFFVNSLSYSLMGTNFSHFWYIGMVVQFYLLFPLLLRLFRRVGSTKAVLLLTFFCWGGWLCLDRYLAGNPDSALGMAGYMIHFNLPGRLPEFAVGMWMASLWNPSASSLRARVFDRPFSLFCLGMALFVVLGTPFVKGMSLPLFHIYHVALCVIFFVILFLWPPVASVGRLGFVREFSVQSYALYIVHEPLFSYLGVMPGKVPHTVTTFLELAVGLLVLSYLAAGILNRLSVVILQRLDGWRRCSPPTKSYDLEKPL